MTHGTPSPRFLLLVLAIGCGSPQRTQGPGEVPADARTAPVPLDASAAQAPDAAQVAALADVPYADIERRCTGGDTIACTDLGIRLRLGSRGAPHDIPRAYSVLDRACTAQDGSGPACSHVAEMLLGGRGTARDNLRAVAMLEVACEGGEPEACRFLGVVLYEGLATPHVRYSADNQRRGLEYLERACSAGHARACDSAESRRNTITAP